MKLDILAFAAHPDDIELAASGTLMKHIHMGKKVGIVDLTQGELGTRGTIETRYQEALEASKIMGIHFRGNLKMADGFFENKNFDRFIVELNKVKPNLNLPEINQNFVSLFHKATSNLIKNKFKFCLLQAI